MVLSNNEIALMREAGSLAAHTLHAIGDFLSTTRSRTVSLNEIDKFAHDYIVASGAVPSPLGYNGYPKSVCTSVNNVVCHGIPGPYDLLDGDIVNVDVTVNLDGYHGDTSATFFIGDVSPDAKKVVEVARNALAIGIAQVRNGVFLRDIGAAIQEYVEAQGCSIVKEYGGHGIGKQMHLPPFVKHYKDPWCVDRLKSGQCITIEPMVNLGNPSVVKMPDDWTITTEDGSLSAQFEHTLLVTDTGCDVLTKRYAPLPNSEI